MTNNKVFGLFCRGIDTTQETSFRKLYWQVGEIRALLHPSVKLAVFTAIASAATKAAIFSTLNLRAISTYVVERSPVKGNLVFHTKNLKTSFIAFYKKLGLKGGIPEDNNILSDKDTVCYDMEYV